ncbi:hypothetical protein Golob_023902 [Gossypium lobatum]|uniref:DUF4283 domain-containing protein n=1 Tax=Gossypium lobatum TaxID=34289 RepID=A0A7J8NG59_9ROSI|nr:hypothetical protein [Gossypium lobatum]
MHNTMADLWHPFGGYSYQILVQEHELLPGLMTEVLALQFDGLVCKKLDKESVDNGCNGRDDRDMQLIWGDDLERLYPNLNNIPLGHRTKGLHTKSINQQNMGCGVENWAASMPEPIDLILEWENDPLHAMDGKKR